MTSNEFVMWLRGFMDANSSLNQGEQRDKIYEKLGEIEDIEDEQGQLDTVQKDHTNPSLEDMRKWFAPMPCDSFGGFPNGTILCDSNKTVSYE